MPAPLALGADDYRAHVKAQARERQRQKRLRDASRDGHATGSPQRTPGNVTPSHTLPVSNLSLTEIERALAPLTKRRYVHAPRFWQLASQQYPLLNLELEAIKAADWLLEPRNAKRRCSKAFLDNWLKKAEQDRKEREAAPAPPRPRSTGPVDPPIAFQTNPGPDPAPWLTAPLERFSPEEEARMREQQARVPYQERLARLAAAATNGVHKP